MARLLLLLAIIVVLAFVVRKVLKGTSTKRAQPDSTQTPDAKLVRCVGCGAYVPRADALPVPDGFRCGSAGCKASP